MKADHTETELDRLRRENDALQERVSNLLRAHADLDTALQENDALRGRIARVVDLCDSPRPELDVEYPDRYDVGYADALYEVRAALKEPQPLLQDKDEKHE